MDYFKAVQEIIPELTEIREKLHQYPELGNQEFGTSKFIEEKLQSWGIETQRMLGTAIVGTLKGGKPGKIVALRSDIDALPLTETTGCVFASQNPGVMHACGHDVHMTSALGAAYLLSKNREKLHGAVKFFFQPDEEGHGGAARMIEQGCMEDVSAVFGAHVDPTLPAGTVGIRYGKFYAAADMFTVTVHGKSAHGATPEKGIDALYAACEMICALKTLPGSHSKDRSVLTVGKLESGTARNIVADKAVFTGILRTLGEDNREAMKTALLTTLNYISEESGTTVDINLEASYSGIVNTNKETRMVETTAKRLLGEEHVSLIQEPLMTTEDFGCFIEASSGCFYHLGAGCELPLHNPAFLPQKEAYICGSAFHASILEEYLRRGGNNNND